jgi:hypothetical protein
MNWKEFGRKHGLIEVLSQNMLEGLRKTMMNLRVPGLGCS